MARPNTPRLIRGSSHALLVAGLWIGFVDCFDYTSARSKSADPGDASTSFAGAAGGTAECSRSCSDENPDGDCDDDGVKNRDDCAPCDPTRYRWLELDDDGDGVPNGEIVGNWACAGAQIPAGVTAKDGRDCNDSDPARFQKACLDADQDGRCALSSEICVGHDIAPPYRLSVVGDRIDCDDNDPTRQQYVFYDDDGDGDRADLNHPSDCVGAPDALVRSVDSWSGGDCDDHDPEVTCSTVDLLFDGRDTNCDGDDGSAQCSQMSNASALCPCWPRETCRVATTCSDRADLNIIDVEPAKGACSACSYPYRPRSSGVGVTSGGGNARILVVNSGGLVFDGTLVVGDMNDAFPSLRTELVLAPGASRIFEVCRQAGSAKLEIMSGDDCLLDNNYAAIQLIYMCGD